MPRRELSEGMRAQLDLGGLPTFGKRPFLAEPADLDAWEPDVAIIGAPFDIATTGLAWKRRQATGEPAGLPGK
jgi:hypothetical protein